MRFLAIYRAVETNEPPTSEHIEAMEKLIEEMAAAGVLITTEGCLPSRHGVRIRRSDGEMTVTDGPFTESKEWVAGFALLQVESMEEAVRWGKRFLDAAGDGESEIRQLYEMPAKEPAEPVLR